MSAKKSKLKKPRDPHKPKTNPSCFFIWCKDARPLYKAQLKEIAPTARAKFYGTKWKAMSDAEKKPYYDKAAVLRKEAQRKMEEYKKTKHYKDYLKKVEEWKQKCNELENNNNNNNQNNDCDNNIKTTNKRKNKWKQFKERREQEEKESNDYSMNDNNNNNNNNDKTIKVTEWDWHSIIQWLNIIENGKFKHPKYSTIKKTWKEAKFRGYELFGLNDLVLRLGGIIDSNDRQIILKNIMQLNKQINNNNDNNKNIILSKIIVTECDVPNEMCCPISYEIMKEPVLCSVSGHTYEKEIIIEYINDKGEDPLTRQKVTKDQLIPNRALKDMIDSWKKKHIISDD